MGWSNLSNVVRHDDQPQKLYFSLQAVFRALLIAKQSFRRRSKHRAWVMIGRIQ